MDLFDWAESNRKKAVGMALASESRAELLEIARNIAREIGATGSDVDADMVGQEMERRGYSVESLGPAAGSIFKGREWEFTGRRVRSSRKSNHGRELKVWRWKKE